MFAVPAVVTHIDKNEIVVLCLQLVYLYVTQPCSLTPMQTRLSTNQSMRTILVIL